MTIKQTKIAIIDDEKNLTRSLSFALEQEGIDSCVAHNCQDGVEIIKQEKPDAILLDVRLGNESGLDLLPKIKALQAEIPVIMISAYGDTKDVVQAIKIGAVDYLIKPFDIDELLLLLEENIARKKLNNEIQYFREKTSFSEGLIGQSRAMNELTINIDRVTSSTLKTILLLGDTGVGKTTVAKEIHNRSPRKKHSFVEINCAALPSELIEAELFGAEKGSYTGATNKRVGLVEVADKGTLFLDEICELPPSLQAKLLTFLESWHYRPIGSPREKTADVLVILATNQNVKERVEQQLFREDLYFRINTMPIAIPNLTERMQDIPLLIDYFTKYYSKREACPPIIIDQTLMNTLSNYAWPGNIRELRNLIERLTILYAGENININQLPKEFITSETNKNDSNNDQFTRSLLENERDIIVEALHECQWRKGLTAKKLGISRHALKRRIQKLGLE